MQEFTLEMNRFGQILGKSKIYHLRPLNTSQIAYWPLGRERLVSRPLRLLGLGVSSLREPAGRQLVLL